NLHDVAQLIGRNESYADLPNLWPPGGRAIRVLSLVRFTYAAKMLDELGSIHSQPIIFDNNDVRVRLDKYVHSFCVCVVRVIYEFFKRGRGRFIETRAEVVYDPRGYENLAVEFLALRPTLIGLRRYHS